ncbi:MAG: hypothetical protein NTV49_12425 [Kiritimatiellaeota bacterium]|nr:hypothetical protein [Kiritimatiellota bacterium]
MAKTLKVFSVVLGLLALFTLGLGLRRYVLDAQTASVPGRLPFTLEGALFFHRVEQVFEKGRLPVVDRQCEYPRGLRVREANTVGAEYFYAAAARLFPRALPLADRVRWLEAGWFCLGLPLLALWIGLRARSRWAGGLAGALYAVALSSVIRSTGQELSHENFALPLLLASFAAEALADRAATRWGFWLAATAAAAALALALMTWDLIQFYVLIWAVWLFVRLVLGRRLAEGRELGRALLTCAALLLAGGLNPYLRAHGFAASPVLALAGGALAVALLRRRLGSGAGSRPWAWALIGLLPLLVAGLLAHAYQASYGHFGELLWAKLRYLNVKPADPALLTFNQRIMWVPALHSATWRLTAQLFPAILLLSLTAAACLALRKRDPHDFKVAPILVGYVISLLGFVLFVRLHVFLSLFAVALLGLWAGWAECRGRWWQWTVRAALLAAVAVEAAQVVRQPQALGRGNMYYRELAELTQWLRQNVAPEPVLANFGVSASILEYGQCPILLHPKFESEIIRKRVREYGELLFTGTEERFRDWAEREGALYYVYALGEFSSAGIAQQMRYFVNAVAPRPEAPAWRFENTPQSLKLFAPVWGNRKYRVFRIRLRADAVVAADQAKVAEAAFQCGQLDRAERYAVEALSRDPQQLVAAAVGFFRFRP